MGKNIFYHFTRRESAHRIKKEGLTKGVTPLKDVEYMEFMEHTQWLTTNGNQQDQQWTSGYTQRHGVSRTAARIKINIPEPFMNQVIEFQDFCTKMEDNIPDGFRGHQELTKGWFVFFGDIPKNWIENIRFY